LFRHRPRSVVVVSSVDRRRSVVAA